MWNWKPAKQMLDALFATGELVVADRVNFQRRYDLPERVLPADILDAPIPSEREAVSALVVKAVRARGALTEAAIVEHVRPMLERPRRRQGRGALRGLPGRGREA